MTTDHQTATEPTSRYLGKGRSLTAPAGARCGRRVGACSAAVDHARQTLGTRVWIHDDASRALDVLDMAPQASAWGRTLRRGLEALSAYAEDSNAGFSGDFFQWCKTSGHARAWPSTSKKLAMRESETVMSNARLRRSRVLPITTDVDPEGFTLMQAHLKIAEGGGDLAPRVYFTMDSRSHTVHVGYIGPHKYMRNTRS